MPSTPVSSSAPTTAQAAASHALDAASPARLLALAMALSMGAAISLGITRFAYGLLLPTMRADLGWTYTLAGAMNTANAMGYLLGALVTPRLLKRHEPQTLLMWGAVLASVFMAASGFFTDAVPLLAQRLLAGVASAFVFIAGGLLAARLGALQPSRMGLLLGLYYGGTGVGITASALLVPAVLQASSGAPHNWAWAWWALSGACFAATALMAWPARVTGLAAATNLPSHPAADRPARTSAHQPAPAPTRTAGEGAPRAGAGSAQSPARRFQWRPFAFALAGYGMFGVGYIGYMTFVIALLREQGAGTGRITLFYALLGIAVMASSRIWAGLLDRYRGGQALAILNTLLGLATIVPALTSVFALVLLSGIVFGAVFLSVVASTTALVRHNLPQTEWAAGISAFTIVFAAGQIVGPAIVGWIADSPGNPALLNAFGAFSSLGAVGGLGRGLVFSALALWLGAALASRQRSLI